MKKTAFICLVVMTILLEGCCASKKSANTTSIYNTTWELEYISGPRIAFEGLYPDKKPFIQFNQKELQFSGNTSCNGYSGKFTLKGNNISFGNAIKTMIFCEGGGEETYLKTLGKVNKLAYDSDEKLLLLLDDIPMMRFKKIANPNSN